MIFRLSSLKQQKILFLLGHQKNQLEMLTIASMITGFNKFLVLWGYLLVFLSMTPGNSDQEKVVTC